MTDQPAINVVENIINEKISLHLRDELPYIVKQVGVVMRSGCVLLILACSSTGELYMGKKW